MLLQREHKDKNGQIPASAKEEIAQAWIINRMVLDIVKNPMILDGLGQGPYEDILCERGEKFIDRVEALTAQNPKVKDILRCDAGTSDFAKISITRLRKPPDCAYQYPRPTSAAVDVAVATPERGLKPGLELIENGQTRH